MYRTIYKATKLTNHQNHTDQVCFFLNKFSITKFHRKTEIDLCMTIKKKYLTLQFSTRKFGTKLQLEEKLPICNI